MAVEVRVIDASGNPGEILPDWFDLTFSQDLIDPGVLTFSYPSDGRNASYLTTTDTAGMGHGVQLVILLDGYEPLNGRFTYFEGTGSRIQETDNGVATFACKSNLARLRQLTVGPAFTSPNADDDIPDLNYVNRTPGYVFRTAVNNAMARANQRSATPAPWLTHPLTSFTTTTDSSGGAWGTPGYDMIFEPGIAVSDVLTFLTDNGLGEAVMDKKTLKFYKPSNHGTDRTSGSNPAVPQVILQTGRDFTEATYETTTADLVNCLLIIGETPAATTDIPDPRPPCVWLYDQASIDRYGYREGTLKVPNVGNRTVLTTLGQRHLDKMKQERWAFTYAVSTLYLDTAGASTSTPTVEPTLGFDLATASAFPAWWVAYYQHDLDPPVYTGPDVPGPASGTFTVAGDRTSPSLASTSGLTTWNSAPPEGPFYSFGAGSLILTTVSLNGTGRFVITLGNEGSIVALFELTMEAGRISEYRLQWDGTEAGNWEDFDYQSTSPTAPIVPAPDTPIHLQLRWDETAHLHIEQSLDAVTWTDVITSVQPVIVANGTVDIFANGPVSGGLTGTMTATVTELVIEPLETGGTGGGGGVETGGGSGDEEAHFRPFIDYQVGDTILIFDGSQARAQRLRLLSATYPNARASSVAITVNDFLAERDVELERRMARLENGLGG